ncbi:unnamed protein product, partial [Ectocarpus fasciculatus]
MSCLRWVPLTRGKNHSTRANARNSITIFEGAGTRDGAESEWRAHNFHCRAEGSEWNGDGGRKHQRQQQQQRQQRAQRDSITVPGCVGSRGPVGQLYHAVVVGGVGVGDVGGVDFFFSGD